MRFCSAMSGRPNLKRIISPCSVTRKRPATEPGGCDRIAAWAGPPPRPTVPPRPWKSSNSTSCWRQIPPVSPAPVYCAQAAVRGTGVLGRIGVADHHFLHPGEPRTVARQRQQALHAGAGVVQVVEGLEQRHHAHRPVDAAFALAAVAPPDVGRLAGHRDHVGPQRRRWCGGDRPAGGEHLGGIRRRLVVRRQQGRRLFSSSRRNSRRVFSSHSS